MITISWEATETITAEGGGDTLSSTLGFVEIDGAETESYTRAAEIPQHAVERGTNIADHVRPGNRGIRLECVISSDPVTVRESLDFLILSGQLVSIQTDVGEYDDMVLVGLTEPRSYMTGDALHVVIEAQQIRRVDTEEIEAPAPIVERARRRTVAGSQSTTSTDTEAPSTSAPNRSSSVSILRRAAEALGGQ